MKFLRSNKQSTKDMNLDLETGETSRREVTQPDETKKKKKINPENLKPLLNDTAKVNIVHMYTTQTIQPNGNPLRRKNTGTEESYMS